MFPCRSTCHRSVDVDFLAGSLAAGAGLLLPGRLAAQEPPVDPNYFVLLADTHVGPRLDEERHGVKPAEKLKEAVPQILALAARPAGAIVVGDCAFLQGMSDDYALFGELTDPLRQAGYRYTSCWATTTTASICWRRFPMRRLFPPADRRWRTSTSESGRRRTPIGFCWIRWIRPM